MRSNMTLKALPLMALTLAAVSCGKKPTDSKPEEVTPSTQNQNPSANLILKLESPTHLSSSYTIKQNGVFTLPDTLYVKSGSVTGQKVSLKFEVNPTNSAQYALKCVYSPSSRGQELDVESCYDDTGKDIGNYTTEVLPMHKSYKIQMDITGPSTNADVYAYFTVDWK